jgi:choline kinase
VTDSSMGGLTAIVLAAGVGGRLGQPSVPKSLLPLTREDGGPTFLERHVGILADCGVGEVVVVLSAAAADTCPRPEGVEIVVNPFDTSLTGSTLSLLCGLRAVGSRNGGILVTDADIVYERALMESVVAMCDRSRLFLTPGTAGDDEEVRIYGRGLNEPVLIGKGLSDAITNDLDLLGESLGVIHVSPDDHELVKSTAEWLVGWPDDGRPAYGFAKSRSEHEEIWQYCFTLRRMAAAEVSPDLLFAECDTVGDYAHIRESLYPSILARDEDR